MVRTRIQRQRQGFAPVAAEVLEVRALLSAGAAAAHAALHQAALHGQTIQPDGFHGHVGGLVSVANGIPGNIPGRVSLSKLTIDVGATVTAHVHLSQRTGGNFISVKGTFVGTIDSFGPQGGLTKIIISPTGGSIVFSGKEANQHISATAVPGATKIQLFLNQGNFVVLTGTDVFTASAPVNLANKPISLELIKS